MKIIIIRDFNKKIRYNVIIDRNQLWEAVIAYKEPLYVIGLDIQKNEVIVGCEEQLYSKEFNNH